MPEPSRQAEPNPARGELSAAIARLVGLFRLGRHAELETLASRVLEVRPESVEALYLVGASRLSRSLFAEAEQVLSRASCLAPEDAQTLGLLGVALHRLGRFDEARSRFESALRLDPESYETLVNASANALAMGDAESARKLAARALAIRPKGVEALLGMGNALLAGGRLDEAAEVYRGAIALAPDVADLHLNLGHALTFLRRFDEAAASLKDALALRPDYAAAHLNLGRALHELGDTGGAQRHFRRAADLDPSMSQAHSAYLFSLLHDSTVSREHAFREHLRVGDLMEAPFRDRWRGHANDRNPERALRIGFVSGDLHEHPVANLIEPVWRSMRGGRNRIHVYANASWRDEVESRLRALADVWVVVEHMSDEALGERIRSDGIDILFDLSGHTAGNRLPVFARKPAPVQVSWIGCPGTTGLSAIDYRFARGLESGQDELQATFRERLVFLRARAFEPAAESPGVNPLPALRRGWLTFGSFNRLSKLNASVIALWCRALLAVPEARLVIAGVDEASSRHRLEAAFAGHAVEPRRLDFYPRLPLGEYLSLHHEVDIAVDTFPYSGGTTTHHALWMGVPVLTVKGSTLQQAHSASVLESLGLSDWAAADKEQFVSRACAAAADLPGLARLRAALRPMLQRSMDLSAEKRERDFDKALRTMWRRWCAGLPPAGFSVDDYPASKRAADPAI